MSGLNECAFLLAGAVTSEKIIVKPTENIREFIFSFVSIEIITLQEYFFCSSLHPCDAVSPCHETAVPLCGERRGGLEAGRYR